MQYNRWLYAGKALSTRGDVCEAETGKADDSWSTYKRRIREHI